MPTAALQQPDQRHLGRFGIRRARLQTLSDRVESLVFCKKLGAGTCHYARACYIRLTLSLVPRFRVAPKQVGHLVSGDMSAVLQ